MFIKAPHYEFEIVVVELHGVRKKITRVDERLSASGKVTLAAYFVVLKLVGVGHIVLVFCRRYPMREKVMVIEISKHIFDILVHFTLCRREEMVGLLLTSPAALYWWSCW